MNSETYDRLAVLRRIREQVGESHEEHRLTQTLIFCVEDGELLYNKPYYTQKYEHNDHVHERAFIFDPHSCWRFKADGELLHFSVGAIPWQIRDGIKQYCLFRRRTFPRGFYTIPSGHVDVGENSLEAALRECYEETKLGVIGSQLLYEEETFDPCRRGADYHQWHLYLFEVIGEPTLSDEGDLIGWFTQEDILSGIPLTRPTAYFLRRYFGVPGNESDCQMKEHNEAQLMSIL